MTGKALPWISCAALVLALAAAIGGALAARQFYFKWKLAMTEPVGLNTYAAENESLLLAGKSKPGNKPRVVLIGDSRVCPMLLPGLEDVCEVVNRGIPGETSAQLTLRIEQDAFALNPDVIVIQSGINDLVAGMGCRSQASSITSQVILHLQQMARQASAAGSKVVLLTVLPPARPEPLRRLIWNERIRGELTKVNDALLEWPAPAGVKVADTATIFGSRTMLPEKYSLNTLHLNTAGYECLNQALSLIVREMLR